MRTHTSKLKSEATVVSVAYSVEDTARSMGIGRSLVFRLIREGQLQAVKIGRRTVVPVSECEAFLARMAGGAA
jgi:excisionase family DNA binding protein